MAHQFKVEASASYCCIVLYETRSSISLPSAVTTQSHFPFFWQGRATRGPRIRHLTDGNTVFLWRWPLDSESSSLVASQPLSLFAHGRVLAFEEGICWWMIIMERSGRKFLLFSCFFASLTFRAAVCTLEHSNRWTVQIDGDKLEADKLAEKYGFLNLGKVSNHKLWVSHEHFLIYCVVFCRLLFLLKRVSRWLWKRENKLKGMKN